MTRHYTVQRGDNLSLIARRECGDVRRWREIVDLNHLPHPNLIHIGQDLLLPDREEPAARGQNSARRGPTTAHIGGTFHQTHALESYVDLYREVRYDLFDPPSENNGNSTTLHVYYHDDTYITIDFRTIGESESPNVANELRNLRVGPGDRVFPVNMNRTTVPNLWRAKHEALRLLDDYNTSFLIQTVPVVVMLCSAGVGIARAGRFSSRRVPRSRARNLRRTAAAGGALIEPVNGHVRVGGGLEGAGKPLHSPAHPQNRSNLQPFATESGGPGASAGRAAIPNLVEGRASDLGRLFRPGSIRLLDSARLRYQDLVRNGSDELLNFARGANRTVAPGGRVQLNIWCFTRQEIQHVLRVFRSNGFPNMRTDAMGTNVPGSGLFFTATKAL